MALKNTLLVVSGPSCAGKSPLVKALTRQHRDIMEGFSRPVLYHTRAKRPGEEDGRDYHFRSREEVEALRARDGFAVFPARDHLQAIEWQMMDDLVARGPVMYEGNIDIAAALRERYGHSATLVDVFIAPLSMAEVRRLGQGSGFPGQFMEMNRRRLIRRYFGQQAALSLKDLQDVEARATTVVEEIARAHEFSHVIPNHDGEDSDHWTLFEEPIGDAGRAVRALASLLKGAPDSTVERWPNDVYRREE